MQLCVHVRVALVEVALHKKGKRGHMLGKRSKSWKRARCERCFLLNLHSS